MNKTLQIQTQIRQNAEEISTALSSMSQWEKQMKTRDTNIKVAHAKAVRVPRAPIRSGVGTVPVQVKDEPAPSANNKDTESDASSSLWQTPSSIVASRGAQPQPAKAAPVIVPTARGNYQDKDLEEFERERGNAEFKVGNFTAAVKSYTKCLGLKGRNYVAFSNRAMAYLKLKEYARAVSDCSCALMIEPTHVKSLLRRSTAYNAVGKHRAALRDLLAASELEPTNKQVRTDLMSTKEQLRNAVSRAPLVSLSQLQAPSSSAAAAGADNSAGTAGTPGVSDGAGAGGGGGEAQLLQGPDPRPPNFVPASAADQVSHVTPPPAPAYVRFAPDVVVASTIGGASPALATAGREQEQSATSTDSTAAPGSSTRVPITFEDDGDDSQEDEAPASTAVAAAINSHFQPTSTHSTAVNTSAVPITAKPTVTTPSKTPTVAGVDTVGAQKAPLSGTKKGVKTPEADKNPDSAVPIQSSYDLERELKLASGDVNLLKVLFKSLKTSQLKSVLKNLSEPTVLHVLLMAVFKYFGAHKLQYDKVCKWFAAVAAVPRFAMQYTLLSEEYKVELRRVLSMMRSSVVLDGTGAGDGDRDELLAKIEDLERKY